jgi:hypothetical protein
MSEINTTKLQNYHYMMDHLSQEVKGRLASALQIAELGELKVYAINISMLQYEHQQSMLKLWHANYDRVLEEYGKVHPSAFSNM